MPAPPKPAFPPGYFLTVDPQEEPSIAFSYSEDQLREEENQVISVSKSNSS
jgi:hypothetical protein